MRIVVLFIVCKYSGNFALSKKEKNKKKKKKNSYEKAAVIFRIFIALDEELL